MLSKMPRRRLVALTLAVLVVLGAVEVGSQPPLPPAYPSPPSPSPPSPPPSTASLLLNVKSQLTDPLNRLSSGLHPWTGTDACVGPWNGIACTSGAPTSLDLTSFGLTGTLPAAVSQLSAFTSISFTGNSFSGSLPTSWSALTQLSQLLIATNQLTGECCVRRQQAHTRHC